MCKRERKGGPPREGVMRRPRGKLIWRRAPSWRALAEALHLSSSAARARGHRRGSCRLGRRAWRATGTAPPGGSRLVAPWQASGPQFQTMSRAMKRSAVGAGELRRIGRGGRRRGGERESGKVQEPSEASHFLLLLSCDLQRNNALGFMTQLFFGTVVCFDEIRQGRETAYAGRHADDASRCVQGGGVVVPDSRRGRADRREMGVPDPSRRAQRPPAFRGIPGAASGSPATSCPTASKMVAGGILERTPDPADSRRVIYSLTPKGEGLLPVVLAMRQWGDEWGYGKMKVVLADQRDGKPVRKICVQAHDGRELKLQRPHLDRPRGRRRSRSRPPPNKSIRG